MTHRLFVIAIFIVCSFAVNAQERIGTKLHAHNDYEQTVPFWEAFANRFESIEVDIFLKNAKLYVAHEEESIHPDRTLESLYLDPIRKAFALNLGESRDFQLLVDVKSDPYKTLDHLITVLNNYKDIIKTDKHKGIQIVISGNRPSPHDYAKYPKFIQFDYQSLQFAADVPMDRVALVSLDFKAFAKWNGVGRMEDDELHAVANAIAKVHQEKKPIRFWGSPDTNTAWRALAGMGVDFINTDELYQAPAYIRTLTKNTHVSAVVHDVYQPTYQFDGKQKKISNVILFIGDGMGLAQITAGMFGNDNQLSLAHFMNIGLSKTQSADDFTTDSAAGATALATGVKTKNRYIGLDPQGKELVNLPEYLETLNIHSGLVTTDEMTGATPSSFYAHQKDRALIEDIAADLAKSPIVFFAGAGKNDFSNEQNLKTLNASGFYLADNVNNLRLLHASRVGLFAANNGLKSTIHGRGDYLEKSLEAALSFLGREHKPFFLMVEGGHIDIGGHSNNTGMIVEEVMDLDKAIGRALRFADENGETLIIVTADHETGGLSLPQGDIKERQIEGQFQSHDHSGIMVPVFAYGPHSDAFRGVYENTHIHELIVALLKKYHSSGD